jgi:steroid delta-isomerase-like uncharacterized protein
MAKARHVVSASLEAFNASDDELMHSLYDDRVAFRAPGGVRLGSADAVIGYEIGWLRAFPDARIEVITEVTNGDWVAQRFIFRGTHEDTLIGPEGDVPATGRAIAVNGAHFVRVEDGKIAEVDVFFDRAEVLKQLGLAPELVRSA